MNKRQTRNGPISPIEPRQPLEKGAHYLRKKSCEPVLSQEKLKAELERRKELSDNRSDLERRLRSIQIAVKMTNRAGALAGNCHKMLIFVLSLLDIPRQS